MGARFLTRDPLEALTRSAYGYAYNDPLNRTDPTGLAPWDGVGDWFSDRWDDVKCGFDNAWDNTLGKIFTCADTGASDVIGAFGLFPPIGGDRKAWIGEAAGTLNFSVGLGVTYGLQTIETVPMRGAVTAIGKVSLTVTIGATAYQAGRFVWCELLSS